MATANSGLSAPMTGLILVFERRYQNSLGLDTIQSRFILDSVPNIKQSDVTIFVEERNADGPPRWKQFAG